MQATIARYDNTEVWKAVLKKAYLVLFLREVISVKIGADSSDRIEDNI